MPLSPPIQLSLCMIVKDEAGMLPEFLARARGLWDELVVVDLAAFITDASAIAAIASDAT